MSASLNNEWQLFKKQQSMNQAIWVAPVSAAAVFSFETYD
jgi:hypothetical protein